MNAVDNELHWPRLANGCGVPYGVFTEQSCFEREQAQIFRGPVWSFVGLDVEVPNAGDFKTTHIGAIPVILTRDREGVLHGLENRCAHRGALVCRELRGNQARLSCVYHQWTYDLSGRLLGVPFRGGIGGRGGMPSDFDLAQHNLTALRIEVLHGLVFASFAPDAVPLVEYLGPMVVASIARLCGRPLRLLGDQRQFMRGNWKLYAENTRDPYHASLLHLFHTTFGLYRSSQTGACLMDDSHRHTMLYTKAATSDAAVDQEVYKDVRSYNTSYKLADPSLLSGRAEFDDGITLVILSVFPNLVLQQIANTLAVRQIVTHGVDGFELVWTHFGYADDDEALRAIRLKQANLIGPAGFVSMEDGEAVEIVQRAVTQAGAASSYIAMGGGRAEDAQHLVTESAIIGFWEAYRSVMGWSET
jgi:anthranilate 1,2-dioxygenase large subunit